MKPREAFALLRKYGANDSVIEHVKAVRDYAVELSRYVDCDRELVETGAILHDIGRCKTHGIDHAIVGAAILRDEKVDERIVRIVERHVGAGLSVREAVRLGLPPGDYLPQTIEEKIVCQADNLIGNKERISIHDAIATAEDKWSPEGLKRLKELQCEVFRPVTVVLEEKACEEESIIEEVIGRMDVLFRVHNENEKCRITLHGREADKAARQLKKLAGRPTE